MKEQKGKQLQSDPEQFHCKIGTKKQYRENCNPRGLNQRALSNHDETQMKIDCAMRSELGKAST